MRAEVEPAWDLLGLAIEIPIVSKIAVSDLFHRARE